MTTYSELVTQIRDYTETTSDVLSDTIVNDFIEHAELKIFRQVDLDVFRKYKTATLTAGDPFISMPGAIPTDFEYARYRAFLLDLEIILRTFGVLLFPKDRGAY